jgi:hypothetical protein
VRIIVFLAVYLPFEEFILKWIPVGEATYLLLRQLPDLVLAAQSMALLLAQATIKKTLPMAGKGIDLFLFLFVIWAFATFFWNPNADLVVGLANIKALVRYILLLYILLILKPTPRQIEAVVRWIWVAVGCQAFIGVIQLAGGIPVRDFLAARSVETNVLGMTRAFTGDRFAGVNDLMGTMGDTISYAYFLLLGQVILMVKPRPSTVVNWLMLFLFVVLILSSGSRAVALVSSVLAAIQIMRSFDRMAVIWSSFAIVFAAIAILGYQVVTDSGLGEIDRRSLWFIFTPDYIEQAMNQRLGLIVYILPVFLFTTKSLIGFSPDKRYFVEHVGELGLPIPTILLEVLALVLEDVYWVAIYIYYGLIGTVFWTSYIVTIGRTLRNSMGPSIDSEYSAVCKVALILLS